MAAADDELIQCRTFEPSKINPAMMAHALDLQRLQLRAERIGWIWQQAIGEYSRSEAKYPDALAVRPDGQKVAIEVERNVKSTKRYSEILVAHVAARRQGNWEWIYYLAPDDRIRNRVERAFKEIKRATWRGQVVEIGIRHLDPFRFYAYVDDWLKIQC